MRDTMADALKLSLRSIFAHRPVLARNCSAKSSSGDRRVMRGLSGNTSTNSTAGVSFSTFAAILLSLSRWMRLADDSRDDARQLVGSVGQLIRELRGQLTFDLIKSIICD